MQKVKINGIDMAFERHGEGPAVLFIHGFPLSGRMWEQVVAPLSPRYELIIPDLRGMGGSEATPTATMRTYVDDLCALLDSLGISRPVVVVGLSMGGYLAFEFYRQRPERIRALVLADTRADPDTPERAKERRATAEKVLREGSGVVANAMIDKLFGRATPETVRKSWQALMSATKAEGVAAALAAMADRMDARPMLATITAPTLIVVGEEDQITTPAVAREMHQAIPGALLKIIPDAGHMAPVEQPQRFAAVLKEFLDRLPLA